MIPVRENYGIANWKGQVWCDCQSRELSNDYKTNDN
jgi:hypothetical protein